MCAIVGACFPVLPYNQGAWSKTPREKRQLFFRNLLIAAQERGSGATGTLLVKKDLKVGSLKKRALLHKAPLKAENYVDTDTYKKKVRDEIDTKLITFLGHTRAATDGTPLDNRNNHPHVCGNIVGIHNGGISNHTEIFAKNSGYVKKKSDCDSEVIFAMINRRQDLEKTRRNLTKLPVGSKIFKEAIKDLVGWMAIAFLDLQDPNYTYLFHDQMSPLSILWWPESKACFFASRKNYIEDAFLEAELEGDLQEIRLRPGFLARIDAYRLSQASGPEKALTVVEEIGSKSKIRATDREAYNRTQGN